MSSEESKSPAPAASERPPPRPSAFPPRPGGPEALVGNTLSGRYRIEKVIGEGGMGAVYLAEHTLMHKKLAVKVLHPEMSKMGEVVARFEREAMAAAHIDHPNVAAATDFGKLDDGSFFLVLEYVEGKSLRELIGDGALDPMRALRIARQVASALVRAHGLGIVHRDLKPENVMLVARDDDPDFVKVLDFGIAKVPVGDIAPESSTGGKLLTQVGMIYGTPEYMAPEQALGQEVDARADLYALGVIIFEMITRRRPYVDDSKVKLLGMHVTAPIPKMADRGAPVPPELDALVTKLLAKEASDRYQDAKEVCAAIDTFIGPSISQPTGAVSSQRSIPDASGPTTALPLAEPGPSPHLARPARPSQLPPRVIVAVVGTGAGLLFLAVIAFVLLRGASRGEAAVMTDGGLAVVATSPSAPAHADPSDPAVKLAQTKLAAGDADGAIAILKRVETDSPTRADAHKLLYQAYSQSGKPADAMDEAKQWLDLDPKAQSDAKLLSDVKLTATGGKDGADAAFALLESKLGTAGPDALYDISLGTGAAALHAKRSLAKADVKKQMSPALAVTLDIYNAQSCDAKKAFFPKAREVGDARTVDVLSKFSATSGCGFLGTRDCFGCMHKDGSLAKTIAAIQARP